MSLTFRATAQQIADLAVAYPFPGWYGAFYSNITQTSAGSTTANPVTFNQSRSSLGIYVASNSRITFGSPGQYVLQFSAQIEKTTPGSSLIDIWLSKNGANVDYTNQQITISGTNQQYVGAWSFPVQVDAQGDYFEIYWSSLDTDIRLITGATQSNPTRPAIPSATVNVNLVCDTSAQALQPSASSAIAYYLANLPTTQPSSSGEFWWDGGVLTQT